MKGATAWFAASTSSVVPSGAARATSCAPMVPPPPGRFSTTAGWPRKLREGGREEPRRGVGAAARGEGHHQPDLPRRHPLGARRRGSQRGAGEQGAAAQRDGVVRHAGLPVRAG